MGEMEALSDSEAAVVAEVECEVEEDALDECDEVEVWSTAITFGFSSYSSSAAGSVTCVLSSAGLYSCHRSCFVVSCAGASSPKLLLPVVVS